MKNDQVPLAAPSGAVFIDSRVPDLATLVAGAAPGEQVFILDPSQDGLFEIANDLAASGLSNLSSISIVAHGASGTLMIGASTVTDVDLPSHATALAAIGAALLPGGTFELYACDTAAGQGGQAFIADLSAYAAGVDVTASTQDIGQTAECENWTLDVVTGPQATPPSSAFTAATEQAYQGTLILPANTGQLFFVDGQDDTAGAYLDTPNPNEVPTAYNLDSASNGTPYALSLDLGDNIYAEIEAGDGTGLAKLETFNSQTHAMLSSQPIASPIADGDLIGGFFVDPTQHEMYVALIAGNTNTTSEILAVSYNPSTGVISTPAYNATSGTVNGVAPYAQNTSANTLISTASDPTFDFANDLALDQATSRLYYTSAINAYSYKGYNYAATNGVYVVSTTGRNQTATELTNSTQFTDPTLSNGNLNPSGPNGDVTSLTINPSQGLVYFTTTSGELYYIATTSVGGNATRMALPSGLTLANSAGNYSNDLTYDPNARQLDVVGAATSDGSAPIEALQLDTAGTTVTSYTVFETLPGTSGADFDTIDEIQFAALPGLTATGTTSSAVQNGAAITLLAGTPTITDPTGTGYLDSATVQVLKGATAVSGDVLSVSGVSNGTVSYGGQTFSVTYNTTTDTLTITSATSNGVTATDADYAHLLSQVQYQDGYADASASASTRTITFQVNNGLVGTPSGVNTATTTVNITRPPPVVGGGGNTDAFTEGGAAFAIDGTSSSTGGVTVSDPAGLNITGATVTISAGYFTGDTLGFTAQSGISVISNTGGVLTLTGTTTAANYQAALRTVTFGTTSQNPDDFGTDASRTISFQVGDAGTTSATATSTVAITAVNNPPTLAGTSNATYTQGGPAVAPDVALNAADSDNLDLAGATVTITNAVAGDELTIAGQTSGTTQGITYSFASDALSLNGSATLATYKSVLDSVDFTSTSANPTNYGSNLSRSIAFVATDGSSANATSNTITAALAISPVDQAPVLSNIPASTTILSSGIPTTLAMSAAASDADNLNLAGATVTETGAVAGDMLAAATAGTGITATVSAISNGTETLALSGSATSGTYNQVLDSVSLAATQTGAPRSVTWSVTDGTTPSAAQTETVNVNTAAPVVATSPNGSTAFVAGDNTPSTPVVIDPGVAVTDLAVTTLKSATVAITSNFVAADVLAFTSTGAADEGDITGAYAAATGVLTLTSASGTATPADFETALRSVTFTDTAITPPNATRTISFTATDNNGAQSNAATRDVAVTDTDQTPTVSVTATTDSAVQGGGAVLAAASVVVADLDNADLAGARVQISGNAMAGDTLGINGVQSGTFDNNSISFSFSGTALTLTGSDTLAMYQAALAAVTFEDTGSDTSTSGHPTRSLTWSVNDGAENSTPAATTLAIDRSPVVAASGIAVTAVEGSTATGGAGAAFNGDSDPDGDTLTITAVSGSTADVGTAVAGTYGSLTLNTDGSFAYATDTGAIDAAAAVGSHPVDAFTFTVSDGVTATAEAFDVTIDRPPVVAASGVAANALEGSTVAGRAGAMLAGDSDADGDTLTISAVNGSTAGVGSAVAGTYGTMTLNADGSYVYDASNTTAIDAAATGSHPMDTFTFAVSDGTTTTAETFAVTIDRPPVVATATTSVLAGQTVTASGAAGALAGDSDPDGDPLSITSVSQGGTSSTIAPAGSATINGTYGSLTLGSSGSYSYAATNGLAIVTAPDGSPIADAFADIISDSQGGTTSSSLIPTVSLAIGGVESVSNPTGAATFSIGATTLTATETADSIFAGVIQDGSSGNIGGNLAVAGSAALTLTGASTYTGRTSVSGTLDIAGFGSIASAFKVSLTTPGATFDISGASAPVVLNKLGATGGTVTDLGAQILEINALGGTVDPYAGVLQDGGSAGGSGGSLLLGGLGTVMLSAANTYTGATTLDAGTLWLNGSGSIATSTAVSLQGAGAVFDISGAVAAVSVNDLSGIAGSVLDLGSGTLMVNEASPGTFAGVIADGGISAGSGGIVKVAGPAALTLTGQNTYTGKTSISGTLDLSGAGSIGLSFKAALTQAGATLDISGASSGEVLNKLGGVAGSIVDLGSDNLKIQVQSGTVDSFAGFIQDGGVAGGYGGSLTTGGAGEFSLVGANTYTGGTVIDAATLDLEALGAAGTGTITFANPANSGVATLEIDSAALTGSNGQYDFANLIAGATSTNRVIDLTSLAYMQGTTAATMSGTVVSVSDGGSDVTLHLANLQPNASWMTASDGRGGTLVYDPPANASETASTARIDTSWIEMAMADQGGVASDIHAGPVFHDPYALAPIGASGDHLHDAAPGHPARPA